MIPIPHAYKTAGSLAQYLLEARSVIRSHQANAVARRTDRNVNVTGREISR